jgi:hypothetical protein
MLFSNLSTKTHALLDYATALTLAVLPRAIGASPKVTALMEGAAAAHAGYALCTDYELGAVRALPMKGHLLLDGLGAAGFIAAGALMDDEDDATRILLAGLGVYELTATLLTQTRPSDVRTPAGGTTSPMQRRDRTKHYPRNYQPPSRSGLRTSPRQVAGSGVTGISQAALTGAASVSSPPTTPSHPDTPHGSPTGESGSLRDSSGNLAIHHTT